MDFIVQESQFIERFFRIRSSLNIQLKMKTAIPTRKQFHTLISKYFKLFIHIVNNLHVFPFCWNFQLQKLEPTTNWKICIYYIQLTNNLVYLIYLYITRVLMFKGYITSRSISSSGTHILFTLLHSFAVIVGFYVGQHKYELTSIFNQFIKMHFALQAKYDQTKSNNSINMWETILQILVMFYIISVPLFSMIYFCLTTMNERYFVWVLMKLTIDNDVQAVIWLKILFSCIFAVLHFFHGLFLMSYAVLQVVFDLTFVYGSVYWLNRIK